MTDNINSPSHYTKGGIETLDYMKAKLSDEEFEGYLRGNILKYITRFRDKNGLEDLKKAEFYLKELIVQQHDPEPLDNYSAVQYVKNHVNKMYQE